MRIYDVTLPITVSLPVWPGDPHPKIERFEKIEEGAGANVTRIDMSVHTGTHVDAPFHFLGGDSDTIEKITLNQLIGRAYVIELPDAVYVIDQSVLEKAEIPPRTRRLIFKTRNSQFWAKGNQEFQTDFVAINSEGAQFLVDRGIRVVGVDYLSVAPFASQNPTHQILLQAGVVIIEGLDLSQVSQGRYTLYCLPLKIVGSDGAPARVILLGV
jgi:arylformamidase